MASYHFKAWECENLRAFGFSIIEQKYVSWDIENSVFIDICYKCLKLLYSLNNSENLIIFKLRKFKFYLRQFFKTFLTDNFLRQFL